MDDSKIIDCLHFCLDFALIMYETGRQIECADLFKQKKRQEKFSISAFLSVFLCLCDATV